MEGQNISLLEVIKLYRDFQMKLIERRDHLFLPFSVKQLMSKLEAEGNINIISNKKAIKTFYSTCIEYLDQWSQRFTDIEGYQWVLLDHIPTYNQIELSAQNIIQNFEQVTIIDTELFDEISVLRNLVIEEKVASQKKALYHWNQSGSKYLIISLRMMYSNLKILVE